MKKFCFTITILSILASSIYGCSSAASTTAQSTTTNVPVATTSVTPLPNTTFSAPAEQIVNAGSSLVVPTNGVFVQAGRHLNLRWASNNNLNGYIFNSAQYNNFQKSNDVSAFINNGYGSQSSFTSLITDSDTYYGVIVNATASGGTSVQLYTAVLTEQ
jgi:hypothetical protein